eukprot:g2294.t1
MAQFGSLDTSTEAGIPTLSFSFGVDSLGIASESKFEVVPSFDFSTSRELNLEASEEEETGFDSGEEYGSASNSGNEEEEEELSEEEEEGLSEEEEEDLSEEGEVEDDVSVENEKVVKKEKSKGRETKGEVQSTQRRDRSKSEASIILDTYDELIEKLNDVHENITFPDKDASVPVSLGHLRVLVGRLCLINARLMNSPRSRRDSELLFRTLKAALAAVGRIESLEGQDSCTLYLSFLSASVNYGRVKLSHFQKNNLRNAFSEVFTLIRSKREALKRQKKKAKLVRARDSSADALSGAVKKLFEQLCPSDEELDLKESLRKRLENILRTTDGWSEGESKIEQIPDVLLSGYGSNFNGLGFKGCDIDLSLELKEGEVRDALEAEAEILLRKRIEDARLARLEAQKEKEEEEEEEAEEEKEIILDPEQLAREFSLKLLEAVSAKFLLENQHNAELWPMVDIETRLVSTARVPILKVKLVKKEESEKEKNSPILTLIGDDGMDCDICVDNQLALHNTRLLQMYADFDPRVRPVIYLVKRWAKRRGINDASNCTLSSYCWVLLTLFYLQTEEAGVLPSLQDPLLLEKERSFEEGHDVTFCTDADKAKAFMEESVEKKKSEKSSSKNKVKVVTHKSVAGLLHGFFRYYAYTFNYEMQVVSVRLGKSLLYRKKVYAEESLSGRHIPGWRLSVEDPFERCHDLGSVVRCREAIFHIQAEFRRATELMGQALQLVGCNNPDSVVKRLIEKVEWMKDVPENQSKDTTVEEEEPARRKGTYCYFCEDSSHMYRDCPFMLELRKQQRGPDVCYRCGEPGHEMRNCPNKNSYGRSNDRNHNNRRGNNNNNNGGRRMRQHHGNQRQQEMQMEQLFQRQRQQQMQAQQQRLRQQQQRQQQMQVQQQRLRQQQQRQQQMQVQQQRLRQQQQQQRKHFQQQRRQNVQQQKQQQQQRKQNLQRQQQQQNRNPSPKQQRNRNQRSPKHQRNPPQHKEGRNQNHQISQHQQNRRVQTSHHNQQQQNKKQHQSKSNSNRKNGRFRSSAAGNAPNNNKKNVDEYSGIRITVDGDKYT